jgi:hypothetical protein
MANKDKVYIVPMWKYRDSKSKANEGEQKEQDIQPKQCKEQKDTNTIEKHQYAIGGERIKMLRGNHS